MHNTHSTTTYTNTLRFRNTSSGCSSSGAAPMTVVGSTVMWPRQIWQVIQRKHLSANQPARLGHECVGGVMDLKTTVSAGHLAAVPGPRWALSLGGAEKWLEVWNSSHNRAEWAFVSWLITADSRLLPLHPHPHQPHHPPICFVFPPSPLSLLLLSSCSPVEKGITNDRRRLPNLSSNKTFQSYLTLGPCRTQNCPSKI